jgi:hypothetical protein
MRVQNNLLSWAVVMGLAGYRATTAPRLLAVHSRRTKTPFPRGRKRRMELVPVCFPTAGAGRAALPPVLSSLGALRILPADYDTGLTVV